MAIASKWISRIGASRPAPRRIPMRTVGGPQGIPAAGRIFDDLGFEALEES